MNEWILESWIVWWWYFATNSKIARCNFQARSVKKPVIRAECVPWCVPYSLILLHGSNWHCSHAARAIRPSVCGYTRYTICRWERSFGTRAPTLNSCYSSSKRTQRLLYTRGSVLFDRDYYSVKCGLRNGGSTPHNKLHTGVSSLYLMMLIAVLDRYDATKPRENLFDVHTWVILSRTLFSNSSNSFHRYFESNEKCVNTKRAEI